MQEADDYRLLAIEGLKSMCLETGDIYVGNMVFGKPHGPGKISYLESDPLSRKWYKGEFENGLREGYGSMSWQDGMLFQGQWKNDQSDGFGAETYPDGSYYLGQFCQDCRHGYGHYVYPQGQCYGSYWNAGVQDGFGYCEIDGEESIVEFKSGELQAELTSEVDKDAMATLAYHLESATNYAKQVQTRVVEEWKAMSFIDAVKIPKRPPSAASVLRPITKARPRTSLALPGQSPLPIAIQEGDVVDQLINASGENGAIAGEIPEDMKEVETELGLAIKILQKKILDDISEGLESEFTKKAEDGPHFISEELNRRANLLHAAQAKIINFEAEQSMIESVLAQTISQVESIEKVEEVMKLQVQELIGSAQVAIEDSRAGHHMIESALEQTISQVESIEKVEEVMKLQVQDVIDAAKAAAESSRSDMFKMERILEQTISQVESIEKVEETMNLQVRDLIVTKLQAGDGFDMQQRVLDECRSTIKKLIDKENEQALAILMRDQALAEMNKDSEKLRTDSEELRSESEELRAQIRELQEVHTQLPTNLHEILDLAESFVEDAIETAKDAADSGSPRSVRSSKDMSRDNDIGNLKTSMNVSDLTFVLKEMTMEMALKVQTSMDTAVQRVESMVKDLAKEVNSVTSLQKANEEDSAAMHLTIQSLRHDVIDAISSLHGKVASMDERVCKVQDLQTDMQGVQLSLQSRLTVLMDSQDGLQVLASDQNMRRRESTASPDHRDMEIKESPSLAEESQWTDVADRASDQGRAPANGSILNIENIHNVVEKVVSNIVQEVQSQLDLHLIRLLEEQRILTVVEQTVNDLLEEVQMSVDESSKFVDVDLCDHESKDSDRNCEPDERISGQDNQIQDMRKKEASIPIFKCLPFADTSNFATAFKRALSARSRKIAEDLEKEGASLLNNLSARDFEDIADTLCRWSGDNALAKALCDELRVSHSAKPTEPETLLSARSLQTIAQLGKEAQFLIAGLGETHLEYLASGLLDINRSVKTPLMTLISEELASSSIVEDSEAETRNVETPKQRLIRMLSAQSIKKLESLLSEGRTLLLSIEGESTDVLEILQQNASSNLVAASLYHVVCSAQSNKEAEETTNQRELVVETRRLLIELLEQGTNLMSSLQKDVGDDILTDILRSSGARTPLAAILFRELCNFQPVSIRDPVAMRRVISARTKKNLDSLLTDGKMLLSRLDSDVTDDIVTHLHDQAKTSPMVALLLYDILISEAPIARLSNPGDNSVVAARCRNSIETLLHEGKELLMQLNNEYAEEILSTISEKSSLSPIASILSFEILATRSRPTTDATKRSLSARSRKGLQDLLVEGRMLLSKLDSSESDTMLDAICSNVRDNPLAAVLYNDIITHWFRSESPNFSNLERSKRALSAQTKALLVDLVSECHKLLDSMGQVAVEKIIPMLLDTSENSILSSYLIHEVTEWASQMESDRPISISLDERLRSHIRELLVEGQQLIDTIGQSHLDSILSIVGNKVKENPISILLYHEMIQRRPDIKSHRDRRRALSAETRKRLSELMKEGQQLFDAFGEGYSKSLLSTIIQNAGTNPMATLLFSDNLSSIAGYSQDHPIIDAANPDSIRRALSARSRKMYDAVVCEGHELLETLDPSIAQEIVSSMCGQQSLLASGLLNELLQYIPDDVSQSSMAHYVDCDESSNSMPNVNSAAVTLQCAIRCHISRNSLNQQKTRSGLSRASMLLQCALRLYLARKTFSFSKKIYNFVHYPYSKASVGESKKEKHKQKVIPKLKSRYNIAQSHRFKLRNIRIPRRRVQCLQTKPKSAPLLLASQRMQCTLLWRYRADRISRREALNRATSRAREESGLQFSDLKLIVAICRIREYGTGQQRSPSGHADNTAGDIEFQETQVIPRKLWKKIRLIQSNIRAHLARNAFAVAFVRREIGIRACRKIENWRYRYRAMNIMRLKLIARQQGIIRNIQAHKIQQNFRAHLARLEIRFLRRCLPVEGINVAATKLKNRAAIDLQRVCRGRKARLTFSDALNTAKACAVERTVQNASMTIQRAFRCKRARRFFVEANEYYCRTYFGGAAIHLQCTFRSHMARKKCKILRTSLQIMQQYASKFAWLKTIQDLVRIAASDWQLTCAKAANAVGPYASFSHAQTLAPAVLPTWWLAHFPVSMSFRVDLKADVFRAMEEQIRRDRINALGGAASYTKTLDMLASLVCEVTESHLVSLSMSDAYSVLVSLMAFCNIHGAALITSVDDISQNAGRDLLMYAERLADGPWFSLPGLAERIEFRQWTQSNLCRMYYIRSEYEKSAQHARLLISSEQGVHVRDRLIAITAHVYLAAAQSKLGKHLTAAATLQHASDALKTWCTEDAPASWTTFCCSRDLERFYSCGPVHLAAVCQHNLAVESVAANQYQDALQAIERAVSLATQDQKESVFLRRVKLTKVAIQTIIEGARENAAKHILFAPRSSSSIKLGLSSGHNEGTEIGYLEPIKSEGRPLTSGTLASAGETEAASIIVDASTPFNQSDTSKKRFGLWFPPSMALRNKIRVDKASVLQGLLSTTLSLESEEENGSQRHQSLFLKINLRSSFESKSQNRSPRKLSPISKTRSNLPALLPPRLVVIAFPMESRDCFEIVCKESSGLYESAISNESNMRLEMFAQAFRELSSGSKKINGKFSGNTLSRMMDLSVLCNRMALRHLIAAEMNREDEGSSASLATCDKYLSIANGLWSGPLKKDCTRKGIEMRALTQMCKAILYMSRNEHQKAMWVLSDCRSELSAQEFTKLQVLFLLNIGTCLSMLDRHKESFEASYQAWGMLQQMPKSGDWFCYSSSHNESELTRHSWYPFAACCKYNLAFESLQLGFEGPCITFATEAEELLSDGLTPEQLFVADQQLLDSLKILKNNASAKLLTAEETWPLMRDEAPRTSSPMAIAKSSTSPSKNVVSSKPAVQMRKRVKR